MNFAWTVEQDQLFAAALEFARLRLGVERPEHFVRARWDTACEFGLAGLAIAKQYGGSELDALTSARVLEAAGQGTRDLGLLFSIAAHQFACALPISEFAQPGVAAEIIPALASGRAIGANAMTEAEAGSDIQRLATRAIRDGDSYVLDGVKAYVTNGPIADYFLVYATTSPAHGYLGLSAFIVPRDTAGLRVGEAMPKVGLDSSLTSSVYLENCRIPALLRLGDEGAGTKIFQRSMAWERGCLFAIFVGAMQRELATCIEHASQRRQFGKAIGKFQAISHRIADMQLRLESARLLLYRACWIHDQGQDAGIAISLAKIAVSEAAVQSGLDAISIHGGLGIVREAGVEAGLRDALAGTVFSGTSDIQRNLIARRLGL